MAPVPRGGTIAVTGAAGFIGGWVVRLLLDKGYRVRACVRDINDKERTDFLRQMPGFSSGRLTLHSADIDNTGCFDEIFRGCHAVAHVSHVSTYTDHDYIKKVCDHIINSINQSGTVSRVVVTSSVAAVMSEMNLDELVRRPVLYEERYPDELDPRRTAERQGYSMGKIIAEHAFSEAAKQNGFWEAITCCPGDNVGPILAPHQKDRGPWQRHIQEMLLGSYEQTWVYRPWNPVDVRDTAACHVGLLESLEVKNGERYIAWSTELIDVEDVCRGIDRLLPELKFKVTEPVEIHPEKLQAREKKYRAIWAQCDLRNDRMKAVTGVSFRGFDESLMDCVESLIGVAKITPVKRT